MGQYQPENTKKKSGETKTKKKKQVRGRTAKRGLSVFPSCMCDRKGDYRYKFYGIFQQFNYNTINYITTLHYYTLHVTHYMLFLSLANVSNNLLASSS